MAFSLGMLEKKIASFLAVLIFSAISQFLLETIYNKINYLYTL